MAVAIPADSESPAAPSGSIHERAEELDARIAARTADLEEAEAAYHSAHGEYARGKGSTRAHAEADQTLNAVRRVVTDLKAERASLEPELQAAQEREYRARQQAIRDEARARGEQAIGTLDAKLRAFTRDILEPLMMEIEACEGTAYQAGRALDPSAGRNVLRRGWAPFDDGGLNTLVFAVNAAREHRRYAERGS